MPRPVITLLTDFGMSDHYVAAMKGVLLGICPEAQLVDISHAITPFQVFEGAYLLSQAWRSFPAGTVHVAVVDPGVGGPRRAILAEAEGQYFVAPDNGILTMALDPVQTPAVREITAVQYFRREVSRTFHGRDIFAPVAAHLANGVTSGHFGARMDDWLRLAMTTPAQTSPHHWTGVALHIDHFGNIVTSFPWNAFSRVAGRPFVLQAGLSSITRFEETYALAGSGELFLIRGSSEYLEISLKQASAAAALNIRPGALLTLGLL